VAVEGRLEASPPNCSTKGKSMPETAGRGRSRTCTGYGVFEGVCTNTVEKTVNPYWCPRCDAIRRETITDQMHEILAAWNRQGIQR
jgi:hypothetical protein